MPVKRGSNKHETRLIALELGTQLPEGLGLRSERLVIESAGDVIAFLCLAIDVQHAVPNVLKLHVAQELGKETGPKEEKISYMAMNRSFTIERICV